MRETSNYKLSQWDKTDRIMMEDFNSDNQKIDEAIKAVQNNTISGTILLAKFQQIDSKISALDQRITALERK